MSVTAGKKPGGIVIMKDADLLSKRIYVGPNLNGMIFESLINLLWLDQRFFLLVVTHMHGV